MNQQTILENLNKVFTDITHPFTVEVQHLDGESETVFSGVQWDSVTLDESESEGWDIYFAVKTLMYDYIDEHTDRRTRGEFKVLINQNSEPAMRFQVIIADSTMGQYGYVIVLGGDDL